VCPDRLPSQPSAFSLQPAQKQQSRVAWITLIPATRPSSVVKTPSNEDPLAFRPLLTKGLANYSGCRLLQIIVPGWKLMSPGPAARNGCPQAYLSRSMPFRTCITSALRRGRTCLPIMKNSQYFWKLADQQGRLPRIACRLAATIPVCECTAAIPRYDRRHDRNLTHRGAACGAANVPPGRERSGRGTTNPSPLVGEGIRERGMLPAANCKKMGPACADPIFSFHPGTLAPGTPRSDV
jgi:hypothetical protein